MSASHTPDDSDRHGGGEVVPIDARRRDRRPVVSEDLAPAPLPDTAPVPVSAEADGRVLEGRVIPRPQLSAFPVTVIKVIVTPENARRVRRHAYFVAAGVAVTARHWRDSRSTAPYHEWIRMAKATGNHDQALEWENRLAAFRRDRHAHRRDRAERVFKAAVMLPKAALGGAVALAGTSVLVAIGTKNIRNIVLPTEFVAHLTDTAFVIVSAAWGPVMIAAPCAALAALWHVGRKHALGGTAAWLSAGKADAGDAGMVVTADTIVLALQHLPIKALSAAFKAGWVPTFHLQPVREGRGYAAVFEPPLGVTPEMIADQRPILARNVHRSEIEVWPSDANAKERVYPAGSVAVWIADPGAVSANAPEYPLMHEGTADVFAGVPGGVSPRGDALSIPIVGNNFVAGGHMGQGKSNLCRVVMLGCSTDPICGIDVFVFANNGDFDAYAPRLARYHKGTEDATVAAAVARLQELYEEVGRREARLAELGAKKLTRQIAEQHPDMRPHVTLFSECHELFGHPEYGEIAAELATKTIKRSRKTGIVMGFDTQSSRKEAIPPKLVELVSVNCCFYVKTWRSNDGFLGDGSFAAGIRATELRPGRDRGTSLVTGISDAQFELLRWYFIEVNDDTGYDAATDVIARSLAGLAPGTPAHAAAEALPPAAPRDLLEDLADVIGDERARLSDLVSLLRDLAPAWPPYRAMKGTQLREQLEALGVRVLTTANVPQLDPADLRRAITERE
jgi:S-DNA-T family DNA segregation ATPase FtsK/SpoIIIE